MGCPAENEQNGADASRRVQTVSRRSYTWRALAQHLSMGDATEFIPACPLNRGVWHLATMSRR